MSQKKAKRKRRNIIDAGPMVTIEHECEDNEELPIEGGEMTVSVRYLMGSMCLCDFIKPMIDKYDHVQITFNKLED